MNTLGRWTIATCATFLPFGANLATAADQASNVVFIVVDQLRWDAMGCAGNTVVKTPSMDRLAKEGTRFTRAYAACPVCVPARASMFTGTSVETHRVTDNKVAVIGNDQQVPDLPSFDQILFRNGFHGEYQGKYHNPYRWAIGYDNAVRPINGAIPPESKAQITDTKAFREFIDKQVPQRPLKQGELFADRYDRPYLPSPIDPSYRKAAELFPTQQAAKGQNRKTAGGSAQGNTYGLLTDHPEECTLAAFTGRDGLEALDRLKRQGGRFTLTISLDPPHPPFVATQRYFDMYPAKSMPIPTTIHDPRTNSPYLNIDTPGPDNIYSQPERIQEGLGLYYALVSETDTWIGKILDRLDQLGLTDGTLVMLTSDHGEMMGDHGMHSKNIFYEQSVRVPLILRLPKAIPAGKVIHAPVSHVDYFATVLDYLGVPGPSTEGRSIKTLINGSENGKDRIVFSEWPDPKLPGFMVCDGHWKLMFGRTPNNPSLDALYNLDHDPEEMVNLIGANPAWEKYLGQAERLKSHLVEHLEKIKAPSAATVKARPIKSQAPLTPKRKITAAE